MNISIELNKSRIKELMELFDDDKVSIDNPFTIQHFKVNKVTITIYKENKKGLYPVVFGGRDQAVKDLLDDLDLEVEESSNDVKKKDAEDAVFIPKNFVFTNDQIGSDEVGTGDFFGPIVVVAALVKKSDLPRLKQLHITDSKKISDKRIMELGKIAVKEFKYSSLVVDNKKFNELASKDFNMNKIKCYLHNRALLNLKKKYPSIKNFCVDQFESKESYYDHLKDEKEVIKGIFFHTKGESYFPSVALASVIARYNFLLKLEEINKKYNTNVPHGGGDIVDAYALSFAKDKGIKALDSIVKKSFKNYKRVVEKLNK